MLRERGEKVGGKKAQLIDRLLEMNADVASSSSTTASSLDTVPSFLPPSSVLIYACKSWHIFGKRASELTSLLSSVSSDLKVYGHARKGWEVEDVKGVEGLEKLKTSKGVFAVTSSKGELVKMKMERPFKDLREADLEVMAKEIAAKMGM
jgi:hypothetical protein